MAHEGLGFLRRGASLEDERGVGRARRVERELPLGGLLGDPGSSENLIELARRGICHDLLDKTRRVLAVSEATRPWSPDLRMGMMVAWPQALAPKSSMTTA